jgi:RNA polymerase sigma-70 factor (ECF subfamily)
MSNGVPSFMDIYNAYFGFVWSTSRHHGVRTSEVDDVTQDVFVTVYRKFQSMERSECMRSWVYTIVRRTVRKYHRKRLTRPLDADTEPLDPELHTHDALPSVDADILEKADLLHNLLARLDAKKRQVFILAELEDLTAVEIAEMLDLPLNTVYSRLRVARSELKAALRRHEQGNVCAPSDASYECSYA